MSAITQGIGLSASLLIMGVIIFICVLLNNASSKKGVPALLAFIALGIVIGNIGSIPVYLDDKVFASRICTAALIFIMFYGGFGTNWKTARPVVLESGLLASAGVLLTAAGIGAFCHIALGWAWPESLLLGAAISSTDAASVFSILRSSKLGLKYNTAPVLEVESGSNDPAAYMLMAVMVSYINGTADGGQIALMLLLQVGVGVACGLVIAQLGVICMRRMHFATAGFDSLMVVAIAIASYTIPDLLHGNGYLSAYIVGIILGNNPFIGKKALVGFFDGVTGLMQMLIFFLLGLLARPANLLHAFVPALAITAGIFFFIRPAAVALTLAPFKRYSIRQRALISYSGLRGASSIVFAIVAVTSCRGLEHDLLSITFCIVLLSIGVAGSFLPKMAGALDMIDKGDDVMKTFNDFSDETFLQFSRIDVSRGDNWDGKRIKDVHVPKGILICRVIKPSADNPDEKIRIVPNGDTMICAGDIVIICSYAYRSEKQMHIIQRPIYADSQWIGCKLSEYRPGEQVQILMILRDGVSIIPDGSTVIEAGDLLFENSSL